MEDDFDAVCRQISLRFTTFHTKLRFSSLLHISKDFWAQFGQNREHASHINFATKIFPKVPSASFIDRFRPITGDRETAVKLVTSRSELDLDHPNIEDYTYLIG